MEDHVTQQVPTPPSRPRPRFRTLEVRRVDRLTPRMLRVTLGGAELDGFDQPTPTQHVKLIVPEPGQPRPILPEPTAPRGAPAPGGVRPTMRTFTIRRFDPASREIDIDFALHEEGPASQWAERADVGSLVALAGPGGRRYVVDQEAERWLIAGDETALPAIATILESLPAGRRADVYAEVQADADDLSFASAGELRVTWLHREAHGESSGELLASALRDVGRLDGRTRVWLACEASVMRRLRTQLLGMPGLDADALVTRGYWKVGEANYPDHDYGQD